MSPHLQHRPQNQPENPENNNDTELLLSIQNLDRNNDNIADEKSTAEELLNKVEEKIGELKKQFKEEVDKKDMNLSNRLINRINLLEEGQKDIETFIKNTEVKEKYGDDSFLERGKFDPYSNGLVPHEGKIYEENNKKVYWNCGNKGDTVEKALNEYRDSKGNPPLEAKQINHDKWNGIVVKWRKYENG